MIIENLALTNFRVFSGRHSFDLSPRTKYKKKRPIILFGGLNGAGKTTTLTAVRLALYGKQSLGYGTSKKEYEIFLVKSIHKSKDTLLQTNTAQIELSFSYAHMGVINLYTVERGWMRKGKKVIEKLKIYKDREELSELNDEQCQGFLNEIIPIGVSDLFFFDGEKIKDLAIDRDGTALGSSIKKLLGLDVINTLQEDLAIFLRNENKKYSTVDARKEIENLEKELSDFEIKAEQELTKYQESLIVKSEVDVLLGRLQNDLSSSGGAWAASREEEIEKQVSLITEKEQLELQLQEIISGSYPISVASAAAKSTLKQLYKENDSKKFQNTAELVEKHLDSINGKLGKFLSKTDLKKARNTITSEFKKITTSKGKVLLIHDVSETALKTVGAIINDALTIQNTKVKDLSKKLTLVNKKVDDAGKNIARAPEQDVIKPIMDKINNAQEKRAALLTKQAAYIDKHKSYLRDAMDVVRKLDVLFERFHNEGENDRAAQYAISAQLLLKDFIKEMSKRKVFDLEHEFMNSFQRLSRKEDLSISAQINPETYAVKLIDNNGNEIDKDDLSAGEKQIYAISVLEALARTSGRRLPIIIDTPLARLDSNHRSKLINNYFPNASHQVIILSTDTEVDESFYEDLSSNISHGYKLDYSHVTGGTVADEGYFWKSKTSEVTS
ncbi:MAG: DNA sulfur modification protein DndD [Burkholderiaceae bacterium]|nr:MAG: DNA sulfur modification protein DndD [Burkholderiaceae bacterium]